MHFTKAQSIVQSLAVERVALAGFQSISSNLIAGKRTASYMGIQALENNCWVRYGRSGVAEDAIEDTSWLRLHTVRLT